MKALRLILLAILFATCEQEQEKDLKIEQLEPKEEVKNDVASSDDHSCDVNNYLSDARQLYFREIKANPNHPNYNKAELDTAEINKILKIIEAVCRLNSPESNLIFQTHKIHALHCHRLNSLIINVRSDTPEGINFVNGKIPTGNKALDNFLHYYGFNSVKYKSEHLSSTWVSIYTTGFYNLIPVMQELKAIPGIVFVEPNGGCFDGNNITLNREGEKASITFSKGEGDCPAGCITRKSWEFTVENNVAKFIKYTQRN